MARSKETGLYQVPGSPYWYISFTHPKTGKQVRQSSKTTVKEMAKQLRAKLYNEAYATENFGEPVSLTVSEIVELAWKNTWSLKDHAEYKALQSRLKFALLALGGMKAASLRTPEITSYIKERLAVVTKPTINREMSDLRSAFNLAIKEGLLKTNPFMGVANFDETPFRRARTATAEERNRLIQFAGPGKMVQVLENVERWGNKHSTFPQSFSYGSPLLLNLIEFDFFTGLRRGELLALEWSMINFDNLTARIASRKGRKAKEHVRYVPLFKEALAVLERCPKTSKFVFSMPDGAPVGEFYIQSAFRRLVKRAEVNDFHFHDIRHSFATQYYRRTKNIAAISYILGHTSVETTMIYLNLSREDLLPSEDFELYAGPINPNFIVVPGTPLVEAV